MARGSTVVHFELDVSDVARGVYASLRVDAAQHPSESAPYLVARVLAYALEQTDGLTFTSGLSAADEPALWVRDRTGMLLDWIEVGTPDGPRLHKASKAARRVAVYCHKDPTAWLRGLARERVHGAASIELFALEPAPLDRLSEALDRRNRWGIARVEQTVYVDVGGRTHEVALSRLPWPQA